MDTQVLNWIYEHSIKYGYSDLSYKLEAHFKVSSRRPSFPKLGCLLHFRNLQILACKAQLNTKADLEQLCGDLEDIFKYKPFHVSRIQKRCIKLFFAAKLYLVELEGLEQCSIMRHLPHCDWEDIKLKFGYEDDNFKEEFISFFARTQEAIECGRKRKSTARHLDQDLINVVNLCITHELPQLIKLLKMLLPTTAIEKVTTSEELQKSLRKQGVSEYTVLLKCLGENVTEAALNKVLEEVAPEIQRNTALENINIRKGEEHSGTEQKEPKGEQKEQIVSGNVRNENSHLTEVNDRLSEIRLNGKTIKLKANSKYSTSEKKLMQISTKNNIGDTQMIIVNAKECEIPKCNSNFVISHFRRLNPQTVHTCAVSEGNDSDESKVQKLKELICSLENYTTLLKAKLEQYEKKKSGVATRRKEEPGSGDGNGGQSGNPETTTIANPSATNETTSRKDASDTVKQSSDSQGGNPDFTASSLACSWSKISDLSLNLEVREQFYKIQSNVVRTVNCSTPDKENASDRTHISNTGEERIEDEIYASMSEECSSQETYNSKEIFDFALRVPDCHSDCRTFRF
ncbi:hypothetical protein Pcinc_023092 [Petrolisthes cinctipes]|uniref:Uncharacterized protein n=1 Tax=Petrolisthes cinctipes TaxID=88211 RepID=A0AAE1FCG4_PETCI|nr:hypothetical protein Pcinc_023092 [Petrolisthes cinctipes]